MPSIKTTTPILGGRYYHLFNRGSNKQLLFYKRANYIYFLKLLDQYLTGYVEILSYCLLPNHFHLVIRIKDQINLNNDSEVTDHEKVGELVVKQFRRLFITYAMAINKQEKRVGNLFDPKYKRLEITSEEYLKYVIFYCHYNPKKHFISDSFEDYYFSSFSALLSHNHTKLSKELVISIFGGREEFINYHKVVHQEKEALILE